MSAPSFTGRLAVLAAAAALLSPAPAFAAEGDHCRDSGREYGQYHAELARQGELGREKNPGQHQGYSSCER